MADPSLIPRSSPLFNMAVESNFPPWRPLWMSNQKPERRRPFGTGLVRHCPQGLFSPFFTFLRATFFRPFRLSVVPTICPWVSEDANTLKMEHWWRGGGGAVTCCRRKIWLFCPLFSNYKAGAGTFMRVSNGTNLPGTDQGLGR